MRFWYPKRCKSDFPQAKIETRNKSLFTAKLNFFKDIFTIENPRQSTNSI